MLLSFSLNSLFKELNLVCDLNFQNKLIFYINRFLV